MKTVTLKRLKINNFKGIKRLDISFEGKETYISGDNASGKTTIFDAFTWLLFDKDSDNRADFNIKPLDSNNNPIRVDVEVEGEFDVEGSSLVLKKTYEEKWVKKRGSAKEEFSGNGTLYEVDDIPFKKNDYKKIIEEKFTDEDLFKLLTNPLYFSTQVKWKDAREIVMTIAGDVDVDRVVEQVPEIECLKDEIASKGVDNVLKSKKANLKKLADQKKEIPTRISEQERMLSNVDVEALGEEIKVKNSEIDLLKEKASGITNNVDEINGLYKQRSLLDEEIKQIKSTASDRAFEIKNSVREKLANMKQEEKELRLVMNELETRQKDLENDLTALKLTKDKYTNEYSEVYKSKPDISNIKDTCLYCGKPLDNFEEEKDKYLEMFNSDRAKKLDDIASKGKATARNIEEDEEELETVIDKKTEQFKKVNKTFLQVQELQKELDSFDNKAIYAESERESIKHLQEKIISIDEQIDKLKHEDSNSEKEKYKTLIVEKNKELEALFEEMGKSKVDESIRERIAELEAKEKEVVKSLATIERDIELCELFITTRVSLLESNINNHFRGVEFKLFETQVNGGINECCKVMVNGVPYADLNTASKINSGLAIIDAVSKHHELRLPIFIDNRESIILLEDVDTQIINLRAEQLDELQISGGVFNE